MSDTKYVIDRDTLVNVGNAIRTKKGTSAQIPVPDLASEILSIPSGGEWTFEEGTVRRTSAQVIQIKVSKQITDIKTICCFCKTPSELMNPTQCGGMMWMDTFTGSYCLYGDATTGGGAGAYRVDVYQGVSVSGDTITLTARYGYRPFPDTDFAWQVVYK